MTSPVTSRSIHLIQDSFPDPQASMDSIQKVIQEAFAECGFHSPISLPAINPPPAPVPEETYVDGNTSLNQPSEQRIDLIDSIQLNSGVNANITDPSLQPTEIPSIPPSLNLRSLSRLSEEDDSEDPPQGNPPPKPAELPPFSMPPEVPALPLRHLSNLSGEYDIADYTDDAGPAASRVQPTEKRSYEEFLADFAGRDQNSPIPQAYIDWLPKKAVDKENVTMRLPAFRQLGDKQTEILEIFELSCKKYRPVNFSKLVLAFGIKDEVTAYHLFVRYRIQRDPNYFYHSLTQISKELRVPFLNDLIRGKSPEDLLDSKKYPRLTWEAARKYKAHYDLLCAQKEALLSSSSVDQVGPAIAVHGPQTESQVQPTEEEQSDEELSYTDEAALEARNQSSSIPQAFIDWLPEAVDKKDVIMPESFQQLDGEKKDQVLETFEKNHAENIPVNYTKLKREYGIEYGAMNYFVSKYKIQRDPKYFYHLLTQVPRELRVSFLNDFKRGMSPQKICKSKKYPKLTPTTAMRYKTFYYVLLAQKRAQQSPSFEEQRDQSSSIPPAFKALLPKPVNKNDVKMPPIILRLAEGKGALLELFEQKLTKKKSTSLPQIARAFRISGRNPLRLPFRYYKIQRKPEYFYHSLTKIPKKLRVSFLNDLKRGMSPKKLCKSKKYPKLTQQTARTYVRYFNWLYPQENRKRTLTSNSQATNPRPPKRSRVEQQTIETPSALVSPIFPLAPQVIPSSEAIPMDIGPSDITMDTGDLAAASTIMDIYAAQSSSFTDETPLASAWNTLPQLPAVHEDPSLPSPIVTNAWPNPLPAAQDAVQPVSAPHTTAPISDVTDTTPAPMHINPPPLASAWNALPIMPRTVPLFATQVQPNFVPVAQFNPYAARPVSMPYTTAPIMPSASLPPIQPMTTLSAPISHVTHATPAPMDINPTPLASASNMFPAFPRTAPLNPHAAQPVTAPQTSENGEQYPRMVWNLLRACNPNDRRVQYLMAHYMNEGFGTPPNPAEAAKLLTRAKEVRFVQLSDDGTNARLRGISNILERYVSINPEKKRILLIYKQVLNEIK
jgi:hypothetical protein